MKEIKGDNWTIRIGQNARENDSLFYTAKAEDLWFHLNSGPSAHVYLIIDNCSDKMERKRLVHQSANMVRLHSKCAMNAKVVYLERRHLEKPKDSSAGQIYMKKSGTII